MTAPWCQYGCHDTGWLRETRRSESTGLDVGYARECPCRALNPVLAARRRRRQAIAEKKHKKVKRHAS